MTIRTKANMYKNAMGTMFLLAAAFFVCSTLISMRSVFADPLEPIVNSVQKSGRTSPRSTSNRTSNRTISRASVASRSVNAGAQPADKTTVSRGVGTRKVSARSITPTRANNTTSRRVVARDQKVANRSNNSSRAVRARSATSNTARVSATGSVMSGARAGGTSYSYLSSKLYSSSYSDIVDSSTGLISADAYSNCMESYYTCMDEICTARSDTKGRCSCAGRVTNFLGAEEALEAANEELIKLSGQLSLLVATKGKGDDLAAAFSLTDAEQVMNCVSYKEATDKEQWYKDHPTYTSASSSELVTTYTSAPYYCDSKNNDYGFDIGSIDGSGSDILAQLKAWADAKDLAKQYKKDDTGNLLSNYQYISGIVNSSVGINVSDDDSTSSDIDTLANKWGYKLFEYAHNNVCGRVLDSCFNGIYEACGTPVSVTDSDGKTHAKCGNGATTNCPFNYNSYISVVASGSESGDVKLNERSTSNSGVSSSASCFGYSSSTTTSGTRTTTTTSTDPYATLRGPVADARRSIMQKYLLDSNAACDAYGSALKQTAQNINYQKIAAEQALQSKRLEFKQEEENKRFADARTAIDNFNECISEIWDCYEEMGEEEDKWTTARIKAYCAQVSQVPHCYEQMICSPLQTQLAAVIDIPDNDKCKIMDSETKEYVYTQKDEACRNVVTISEILYGTGVDSVTTTSAMLKTINNLDSKKVREGCLREALGCTDTPGTKDEGYCLRKWSRDNKTGQNSQSSGTQSSETEDSED